MSKFFTNIHEINNDTSLENHCKLLLGKTLNNTNISNLTHCDQYNYDLHQILKRIYSIMLDDMGYGNNFKYKDLEEKSFQEPIFLVKEGINIVHVFNKQLISEYYNNFDGIQVTASEFANVKCAKFKKNCIMDLTKLEETHDGIKITKQAMDKLLKLYVLADHAVEHFYNYIENKSFDYDHEYFGKNDCFLSSIFTKTPDKDKHKLVFGENIKKTGLELFTFKKNNTSCSESSDSE